MKILHVITSMRTGGAEKLMVDLLPRLKEKGCDVDLLLFDGTDTPFRRDVEKAGIRVFDLGKGGSVYSPLRLFRLFKFLKRYDVVHTHNTAPQLFAAVGSVLCSVVLCTTEHNTSNRRRDWRWYAAVDRWMYNRYRHIICISEKTEANLRHFIKHVKSSITTINNGIDVKAYANVELPVSLKNTLQCRIALMQVAGFRYQKDQETVIRSLKFLPNDIHLFLVGDGVRRQEIENLINDLDLVNRVHLMGIRNDVPQLLASADIVIMSSHWEGFGLAAAEGMAARKPVIASNVDGLREVVKGAGILFPHGDAKALADEILKLDNDKEYYDSVATACFNRAKGFDISKMVDDYADIYNSLTEK